MVSFNNRSLMLQQLTLLLLILLERSNVILASNHYHHHYYYYYGRNNNNINFRLKQQTKEQNHRRQRCCMNHNCNNNSNKVIDLNNIITRRTIISKESIKQIKTIKAITTSLISTTTMKHSYNNHNIFQKINLLIKTFIRNNSDSSYLDYVTSICYDQKQRNLLLCFCNSGLIKYNNNNQLSSKSLQKQQKQEIFSLQHNNNNECCRPYNNIQLMSNYNPIAQQKSSRISFGCSQFRTSRSTTIHQRFMSSSSPSASISTNNNNNKIEQHNNTIVVNEQMIQDMLYRIRYCNNVPNDLEIIELIVDNISLGKVRPHIVSLLCNITVSIPSDHITSSSTTETGPIFELINDEENASSSSKKKYLTFTKLAGSTYESRTVAVSLVMDILRETGIVKGWRDELLPIRSKFYDTPLFSMERAAVPLIGAIEYGVHINGIIKEEVSDGSKSNNSMKMWIARRSKTKSKYPGMLDHIVAGGQPIGISLYNNVIKECYEEAGISSDMLNEKNLIPVSAISYESYIPQKDIIVRTLYNNNLYLYVFNSTFLTENIPFCCCCYAFSFQI